METVRTKIKDVEYTDRIRHDMGIEGIPAGEKNRDGGETLIEYMKKETHKSAV